MSVITYFIHKGAAESNKSKLEQLVPELHHSGAAVLHTELAPTSLISFAVTKSLSAAHLLVVACDSS